MWYRKENVRCQATPLRSLSTESSPCLRRLQAVSDKFRLKRWRVMAKASRSLSQAKPPPWQTGVHLNGGGLSTPSLIAGSARILTRIRPNCLFKCRPPRWPDSTYLTNQCSYKKAKLTPRGSQKTSLHSWASQKPFNFQEIKATRARLSSTEQLEIPVTAKCMLSISWNSRTPLTMRR